MPQTNNAVCHVPVFKFFSLYSENENGMEEYSEFGDGWSKVPPRPVSSPAPR